MARACRSPDHTRVQVVRGVPPELEVEGRGARGIIWNELAERGKREAGGRLPGKDSKCPGESASAETLWRKPASNLRTLGQEPPVSDVLDLVRGTLDLFILKTLTWGPMHGLAILRWIEQVTENDFNSSQAQKHPARNTEYND